MVKIKLDCSATQANFTSFTFYVSGEFLSSHELKILFKGEALVKTSLPQDMPAAPFHWIVSQARTQDIKL